MWFYVLSRLHTKYALSRLSLRTVTTFVMVKFVVKMTIVGLNAREVDCLWR